MVRAGYNGGNWLGNGITSSTANANRNFALGVADNAKLAIPFGDDAGCSPGRSWTRPRSW